MAGTTRLRFSAWDPCLSLTISYWKFCLWKMNKLLSHFSWFFKSRKRTQFLKKSFHSKLGRKSTFKKELKFQAVLIQTKNRKVRNGERKYLRHGNEWNHPRLTVFNNFIISLVAQIRIFLYSMKVAVIWDLNNWLVWYSDHEHLSETLIIEWSILLIVFWIAVKIVL